MFVSSAHDDHSTEPLPFLDYDCCFYNKYSHSVLEDAGVNFRTVFSASTSADVRSAVEAGIGVAVMGASYLDDNVVEWRSAAELGELPAVHQVLRTVPGEQSEVIAALVETIRAELTTTRPVRRTPQSL